MTTDVELVNRWLEHQERERGRSTQTLYSYSQMSKALLRELRGQRVTLSTVSTDELRGWVHAPLTKGRLAGRAPSDATVKRRVAMLRSLYAFLHAEGLVDSNPSARLFAPTVRNENPKPVDLDAWRKLWNSDLSVEDRAAFGLALFCGLRRSEVVAVKPQDFDDSMLSGFRRKGGRLGSVPWRSCVSFFAKHDASLLGGDAGSFVDALDELRRTRPSISPLIPYSAGTCTTPRRFESVDPQHLNRHLERSLRGAGMPANLFTPHQLRHTFCTLLLDWGVPLLVVSRLAGHANVTVTERYIRTKEDPLADLLEGGPVEGVREFDRI